MSASIADLIDRALSRDTVPVAAPMAPAAAPAAAPAEAWPTAGFTPLGCTAPQCAALPLAEWPQGWRNELARVLRRCAGMLESCGWARQAYGFHAERALDRGVYRQGARYSIDGALYALIERPHRHLIHAACALLCMLQDVAPHYAAASEPGVVMPELCTAEVWAVSLWNDALPAGEKGQMLAVAALRWAADRAAGDNGEMEDGEIVSTGGTRA